MGEPTVLVNFRLDRSLPLRFKWLTSNGVPGDGYKAQVTAIKLMNGVSLAMHASAIMEQTEIDPGAGVGAYTLTFNGMVGFAADHADRKEIDAMSDQEVDYDLEFVHDDTGRVAVENTDYRIIERPRAHARKLVGKP